MMERRENKRADFDVLVNNSLLTRAPIKNVSEQGICITTHTAFSKGDIVVLDFSLPNNTTIKAYGKVKWHQKAEDGVIINGLEFWHIEQECREKIADFVKQWTANITCTST